jgi:hypothetical protein
MNDSPRRTKLDDLLAGAVDLRPQPDFAAWQQSHPEAVEVLQSLPTTPAKRRSKMIRIARYSTSVALVLFVAVAAWWMFFGHGTATSWAQVIDQIAKVRNATCRVSVRVEGMKETGKIWIEGDQIRYEDAGRICITDCREKKGLEADRATKKARIIDLRKNPGELTTLGGNPLGDLVKLKDAASKPQPDETIEGIRCHVYRVDNPVFMGEKMPWLKLWVDPSNNLPVQIHTVVGNGHGEGKDDDPITMTFDNFRWNEPFEKGFMELVAPPGYELVDESKAKEVKPRAAEVSMQASVAALDAADGPSAKAGREMAAAEAAKILDMIGQRIEANYKTIKTWSGTYDIDEPCPMGGLNTGVRQPTHAVVDFIADIDRNRLRTDYRESELPVVKDRQPQPKDKDRRMRPAITRNPGEWHWVKTPECTLQFSVKDLRNKIEGFSEGGSGAGPQFRILYREGAGESHFSYCVDPRLFLKGSVSSNGGLPYWRDCAWIASVLRGEHPKGNYAKNTMLRERRNGTATEYVLLIRHSYPDGGCMMDERVYSSEVGFNVVSERRMQRERLVSTKQTGFRQEKGIFLPVRIDSKGYQTPKAKDYQTPKAQDAADRLFWHRISTLTQTNLNEPIDPAMFEISTLGLRPGDRMADWIEHRVQVFDGKQFVPAGHVNAGP